MSKDDVGYKKPPKAHQFKPGQSGNPKGRPKGSKNIRTLIDEELSQTVTITEGGRRRTVPKRDALVKQLVNRAMQGDLKAMQVLSPYLHQLDQADDERSAYETGKKMRLDDQALLQRMLAQLGGGMNSD